MSKEFIVEVRIKYDELMSKDELDIFSIFSSRSSDAIKRRIVEQVVEKYMTELPKLDIDLTDLKEQIKAGIVERKIDEVLDD
jgi:endonuclease III